MFRVVRFWNLFLCRDTRPPDNGRRRHQVFSRDDGEYAEHQDRKTQTGWKVLYFLETLSERRSRDTEIDTSRIFYNSTFWLNSGSVNRELKAQNFREVFHVIFPAHEEFVTSKSPKGTFESWQIRTRGVRCLSCRERRGLFQVSLNSYRKKIE